MPEGTPLQTINNASVSSSIRTHGNVYESEVPEEIVYQETHQEEVQSYYTPAKAQKSAQTSPSASSQSDPVNLHELGGIEDEIDEIIEWLCDNDNWYYTDENGWAHMKADVAEMFARLRLLMNILVLIGVILAAKADLADAVGTIMTGIVSKREEDKALKNLIEKQKNTLEGVNDILIETLDAIDEINKANYEKKCNEIEEEHGKPSLILGILTGLVGNSGAAGHLRDAAVASEMADLEQERAAVEYQNFLAALRFVEVLNKKSRSGDDFLDEMDALEERVLSHLNVSEMFQYAGDNGIGDDYRDMNKNMAAAIVKAITVINNLRNLYAIIRKAQQEMARFITQIYYGVSFSRSSQIWTAVQTMLNEQSGYIRSAVSMAINRLNAYIQTYNNMVSQRYQEYKNKWLTGSPLLGIPIFMFIPFGISDAIVLEAMPDDTNIPSHLDRNEVDNILREWGIPMGNSEGDEFLHRLDAWENELLDQITYANLARDTGDGFQDMEYEKMKEIAKKLNFISQLRELYILVQSAKHELAANVSSIQTGAVITNMSTLTLQMSRDEAEMKSIFAKLKFDTVQKEITENNKQRQYELDREDAWNMWIGAVIGIVLIAVIGGILLATFGAGSALIPVALGLISSGMSIGQSIMDAVFISSHMLDPEPYKDDLFFDTEVTDDDFDAACQAAIDLILTSSVFTVDDSLGTVAINQVVKARARQMMIAAYVRQMIMIAIESGRRTIRNNVLSSLGVYVEDNTSSLTSLLSKKFSYYSDVLGYKLSLVNRNISNYNEYLAKQREFWRAIVDIIVSSATMVLNALGPCIGDAIGDALNIISSVINIGYDVYTTIRDFYDAKYDIGELESMRRFIQMYFDEQISRLDENDPYYELRKNELEAMRDVMLSSDQMLVDVGRGYSSTNYIAFAEAQQDIRAIFHMWEAMMEAQDARFSIWQVATGMGTSQSVASNISDARKETSLSILNDLEGFWDSYADRLNEINDAKRNLFQSVLSCIVETIFSINNIVKTLDDEGEGFLDFMDVENDASVSDKVINAILKTAIKQLLLIHLSELFNLLFFGTDSHIPDIPQTRQEAITADSIADSYA